MGVSCIELVCVCMCVIQRERACGSIRTKTTRPSKRELLPQNWFRSLAEQFNSNDDNKIQLTTPTEHCHPPTHGPMRNAITIDWTRGERVPVEQEICFIRLADLRQPNRWGRGSGASFCANSIALIAPNSTERILLLFGYQPVAHQSRRFNVENTHPTRCATATDTKTLIARRLLQRLSWLFRLAKQLNNHAQVQYALRRVSLCIPGGPGQETGRATADSTSTGLRIAGCSWTHATTPFVDRSRASVCLITATLMPGLTGSNRSHLLLAPRDIDIGPWKLATFGSIITTTSALHCTWMRSIIMQKLSRYDRDANVNQPQIYKPSFCKALWRLLLYEWRFVWECDTIVRSDCAFGE